MSRRTLRAWTLRVALLGAGLGAVAPDAVGEERAAAPGEAPSRILFLETESPRAPSVLLRTPLSISVVSREEITEGRPAFSLDQALDRVPGVFAQSGENFAQDSRISIRGYGARAEFGVRGIRVLVDGVPNTAPDGQTELDSIDLAFVDRIDIVRGPVSSLYGGGGGGLLAIDTIDPTATAAYTFRSLTGSHGLVRHSATATGTVGGVGYALGAAYTRKSGYREHSRGREAVWLGKLVHELDDGTELRVTFSGVGSPESQEPAGLTAAEVARDRRMARAASLERDARERVSQQKLSLQLRRPFASGRELVATAWHVSRDLANALPIDRRVDLDRAITGGSLVLRDYDGRLRWTAGVDTDIQSDERRNYRNVSGARGALTLRQSESVRSTGPFVQAEWLLTESIGLTAGLRYDWVEFEAGDRFTVDGDRSDDLRFRQLSPRLGVRFGPSDALQAYANLASAFRAPTTKELAPSDASGGFQSDIDPESTLGIEIGAKGVLGGGRFFYDVALFDLHLRNVAVEVDDGTNLWYRDAGRVRRRGLELATSTWLGRGLSLRTSYTFADYRYRDYSVVSGGTRLRYDGNREPNVPRHLVFAELRYEHPSGPFAALSVRHSSDIEVNDANTAESDSATVANLHAGWRIERRGITYEPFVGVRNATGVEYDATLRPNAFGGRYYEPAPEAELYVGMELRFGR